LLVPGEAEGVAAAAHPDARWREIEIDAVAGTVSRPAGLEIDSGGVAKGWAADRAARLLGDGPTYAVACSGDISVGGSSGAVRAIAIADPFGGEPVAELGLASGGVATSGIGRRRWRNADGTIGHHLIDPATGRPCFSGIVQATAFAPTAEEAEIRAKAAVLSGPWAAAGWLPDGGVAVLGDGSTLEFAPCNDLSPAVAA
jgi:thiamine biosynthesis lipoprotein